MMRVKLHRKPGRFVLFEQVQFDKMSISRGYGGAMITMICALVVLCLAHKADHVFCANLDLWDQRVSAFAKNNPSRAMLIGTGTRSGQGKQSMWI